MGTLRRIIIRRRPKPHQGQVQEVVRPKPKPETKPILPPKTKPARVWPKLSKPVRPPTPKLPKPIPPRSKIRALDFGILGQNFAQCNTGANYDVEMALPLSCKCEATIHRCWFVASTHMVSIDLNRIVERLFARTQENKDQLLKYCVHHLLTRSDLTKLENWVITTAPGEYGEAIDTVMLKPEVLSSIKATLNELLTRSNVARLSFAYGVEMPPNISKCGVETVLMNDLHPKLYPLQLLPETLLRYNNYTLPSCVCIKGQGKYKVIDGFKRLTLAQQSGRTEVSAIVLEE